MSDGTALIYVYDGSFYGLMCCIHESFYKREIPSEIVTKDSYEPSLFAAREILSDEEKALKVKRSIREKISDAVLDDVERCYFSCTPNKEMLILKYVILGFKYGAGVTGRLADDTVNEMFKAVKTFSREAYLYREFLRFTENDGVLSSVIEPKNFVLPYIASHYADRLGGLSFFIYDKTHGAAIISQNRQCRIVEVEDFVLPAADENERKYRELWKRFYNTIGIKERYSDKRRMTMMPKRYWSHLTEFEDLYPEQTDEEKVFIEQNRRPRLK